MIIRFTSQDDWDLGPDTAEHLIEVDPSGVIVRLIDLDRSGRVVDAAPTKANPHGAIDHAPLDMLCDWSRNAFPGDDFEKLWARTMG